MALISNRTKGLTAKDEQAEPFWRTKTLDEMSVAEWESLCDGCGRCCLVKLEDEDTGEIHFTDIGCKLLDGKTCRCIDYPHRHKRVPDCVRLTADVVRQLSWLPVTCAYRLVAKGEDLPDWHPLVSGTPDSVREAGVSVQRTRLGERERRCARALAEPGRQMAEPQAARQAVRLKNERQVRALERPSEHRSTAGAIAPPRTASMNARKAGAIWRCCG